MASHMKNHLSDYTFATYKPEVQSMPGELPSHMIEVELSLEKNTKQDWFQNLKNDLQRNDMKVCVNRNNIIVTGIPPDEDFSPQTVLEIVQRHDSGAEINSFKELHDI